jgi:hypothetical protein
MKNPSPELARRLLGGLVRRAMGLDWDFSTPHFDGHVALQSAPQLFDEAVPDINLYQAMYTQPTRYCFLLSAQHENLM